MRSLMRRPMERVAVPLRMMGANITTRDRPPAGGDPRRPRAARDRLHAAGRQRAGEVGASCWQALRAHGRTRITEPAPSRDHTERMLGAFGVERAARGRAIALEGGQSCARTHVAVPGDFSSAAFFIVAGCLAARSRSLRNVGVNPTRTGLLDMLRRMGADIRVHARAAAAADAEPVADIEVRASALRGIKVPEALVPLAIDEFPVFFIAAACAQGRDAGARRARAAGQGERSAGRDGAGPGHPWRRA